MLKNKRIVIVGGSSGIGLNLAEHLVKQGSEVILASRSHEKLVTVKSRLNNSVSTYQVDASVESSVIELFSKIGKFDYLVVTIKPEHLVSDFSESNVADSKSAFDSKFWGQYYLTRHCLNFIDPNGAIVLTSGIASQKSYRGFTGAAAINGAVESFVKSVASEISPIRINTVCPGFIESHSNDVERYEAITKLGAHIPLARLGTQREVSEAFVFLLENSYVTGTTLTVDGGELTV